MTKSLHLIQAGVQNGDKVWIEKAASRGLMSSPDWVVPKSAVVGDEVVIFIGGSGFFAPGRIASAPKPRRNWVNRYSIDAEKFNRSLLRRLRRIETAG